MPDLSDVIDAKVGEVRFDPIDLSFGEIVNLHDRNELIIQPEYQRLFRWSYDQRSRLVESIMLELPIPQIFVVENEDGVLELIDGLQRISSIIHFMNSEKIALEPLALSGCDLIEELNGLKFEDLPLRYRLQIKRSSVRTIIIKRQSKAFLRYEMFKRLNTGGARLSHQEIRNCSARMAGEDGTKFYTFIQHCAGDSNFKSTIGLLSQAELEKRGNEELVLRFFALKNAQDVFKHSVKDWLDQYMEEVIFNRRAFDYDNEAVEFCRTFKVLNKVLGESAFVKYREGRPIGSLAPAYFEAVSMGVTRNIEVVEQKPEQKVRDAVVAVLQSDEFKQNTGPGANTVPKLDGRIRQVSDAVIAA